MARRSRISKADEAAEVGSQPLSSAEELTDDKLKTLQDSSVKDVDVDKSEDDDDEDEDDKCKKRVNKSEDDDDDDDDEDDDEDDTAKSHASVDRKLRRAVANLAGILKASDPSMRKEALFAKSMNGGRLSEVEADELDCLVRGRPIGEPLRERATPQLTKSFRKAVAERDAVADLAKGVAGSHAALCDEIDSFKSSMDEVHCGMAKALSAVAETVAAIHKSQGAIAEALDKSLSQPAHAPRSHGVSYIGKSFNGGTDPELQAARAEKSLRQMAGEAPDQGTRLALTKALYQLQTTKTVPAPVEQMIKAHLAGS